MDKIKAVLRALDDVEASQAPTLASALEAAIVSVIKNSSSLEYIGVLESREKFAILDALRGVWAETATLTLPLAEEMIRFSAKAIDLRPLDEYISSYGASRAQQILNTTSRQIRDMIAGGMAAGNSADAVFSALLDRAPQIARIRSLLITRTEAHTVSQFSSYRLALRSAVPLDKIWHSTQDMVTRDFGEIGRVSQFNHRVMDGTRIALARAFQVPALVGGTEALSFPGDPRGSAGNVIHCRCIQSYERAS
jgi:hypothetical protein